MEQIQESSRRKKGPRKTQPRTPSVRVLGAGPRGKRALGWGLVLTLAVEYFFFPPSYLKAQDFGVGKRFLCRA